MRVTAIKSEAELLRIIAAREQGVADVKLSQRFGVDRKTIARAVRLYREMGAAIFESEKLPQRGRRHPNRKKPEEKYEYTQLLCTRWRQENYPPDM